MAQTGTGLDFPLATLIDDVDPNRRVCVMLNRCGDGGCRVALRQQSWAQGIGWFDQSTVDLTPGQMRQLRSCLHAPCSAMDDQCPTPQGPDTIGHVNPETGAYRFPRSA